MKIAILILLAITLIAVATMSSIDKARQANNAFNSPSNSGGNSNNQAINIARIMNGAYNANSNSNSNTDTAINVARGGNRAFNANPSPDASTNPVFINKGTAQSNVQSSYAGDKKKGCHLDETGQCKNHDNACVHGCVNHRPGVCSCSNPTARSASR